MDWLMKLARRVSIGLIICWILSAGVFILYVTSLKHRYERPFENIVVLTGGRNRIASAFHFAEIYKSKNVFISGVYEKTTLRDLAPPKSASEVKVVLGKQAKNTEENAREISEWAKQNGISEYLLVTSDYHIPRSEIALKNVDDSLKIYPYAVKSQFSFDFIRRCIKEFHGTAYGCVKFLFGKIRGRFTTTIFSSSPR
ncbi:MAG: YdcF family protein [Holosporaceae bacterium]|jgi:uncharacterized SAM-binding protein YcdF (DUF218 family)|nr:YdcF family protein [Holosporaceae bacterium]